MKTHAKINLAARLDKFCAVTGALFPSALIMGNTAFELTLVLVGLGWISRLALVKKNPFPELIRHPLLLPWLIWYTAIVVSLLINGAGHKGWGHDIVLIRHLIFAAALIDISSRLPVSRYLLYGLAGSVIWMVLNTLSAYILGHDFLGKQLLEYQTKLNMTGRIAGLTAYAGPLFIGKLFLDKNLTGRAKGILAGFGIAALLLLLHTHIRVAFLGSLAGILSIVFLFLRRYSNIFAISLLGILLMALVAGTYQGSILFYSDSFPEIYTKYKLWSIYDRVQIWKTAWAMWRDSPFFGVGLSSFQDCYKEYAASGAAGHILKPDGTVFINSIEATHAHNLALMLLASTGIFGLFTFGWLFINIIRLIISSINTKPNGFISWPIVFFVIGLAGFNIYHSWYMALFAFLLSLVCTSLQGKTSPLKLDKSSA